MTVESDDLAILRETTSKTLLALLWLHVPIAVAIGLLRGADWIDALRPHGGDGAGRDHVVAHLGQRAFDAPDLRGRIDGRRLGLYLPTCRPRLADRHAHVFLCGAGVSRRLLRPTADPRRRGRRGAASSGAELPPSGRGLSRRRRPRPRRSSRRHPFDRGGRAELAGATSCRGLFETTAQKTAEAEAASAAEARANIERG